ncbi:MAG: nucleotide exchange factor GrpE [Malacoplasma sp.]
MNNKDKYKNEDLNTNDSRKDVNESKGDKKEAHILHKKNVALENEIKKLNNLIDEKSATINELNKTINDFNANYKNEIIKKSEEAQLSLNSKVKEYQEKFDKDVSYIRKYCLKDNLPELIDIISNFESALKSSTDNEVLQNYLKGFEMFLAMFKNYLINNNVIEISIKPGDIFNEKTMEPIDVEKSDSFKTNQVIKVLKPGYMLYDLVIKPAIVIIAK